MTDEAKAKAVEEIRALWHLEGVEVTRVMTTGWGAAGHPFTIGPRHVSLASDEYGGMLGKEVMEKVPCAHKGCRVGLDGHQEECSLLVTLLRDVVEKELADQLSEIKPLLKKHGLAGVGFGGTDKYRLIREDGTVILGPAKTGKVGPLG